MTLETKDLAAVNIPMVTVIAVCFNHARYINECLDSIRAQSYKNFELIIMDDCSTDESVAIIQAWIDRHHFECRFVAHHTNQGICKTLNEALRLSRTEYICFIATDDRWLNNKLENHLAIASACLPDVAVIYSDTAQIDEAGNSLPLTHLEEQRLGFSPPSGNVFEKLADRNFVPAVTATLRKQAVVDVGGYDERQSVEDYDMWLRLAEKYKFLYSPEITTEYRIVSNSVTRKLFKNPTAKYAYGQFLMLEKWLSSTALSAQQRVSWAACQADAAYWLYFHADSHATRSLWVAARRSMKFRIFCLALLSTIGMRRNKIKRLIDLFLTKFQKSTSN